MPNAPVVVALGEILWDLLPAGKQLGGAPANFAFHAGQLGAQATTVSAVGDDPLGRELLARLAALGVDARFIAEDPAHWTGTVSVEVGTGGTPAYTIHEDVAWDFLRPTAALRELVGRADCVCFGSLAQRGETSRRTIRDLIGRRRPGALTIFDVNLRPPFVSREVVEASLAQARVLKISDAEVLAMPGLFGVRATDFDGALAWLRETTFARFAGLELIALTRGHRGAALYARDGRAADHPGYPAEPLADTIGVGDAFTTGLAVSLLRGLPLERVIDLACRVASFVCTQPGATPVLPAELVAAFA